MPKMQDRAQRRVEYWNKQWAIAEAYFAEHGSEWWGTYDRRHCEAALDKARADLQRILNAQDARRRRAEAVERWKNWPHP